MNVGMHPSAQRLLWSNIAITLYALFAGWSAFQVFFTYVLETAVIGFFCVLKIWTGGVLTRRPLTSVLHTLLFLLHFPFFIFMLSTFSITLLSPDIAQSQNIPKATSILMQYLDDSLFTREGIPVFLVIAYLHIYSFIKYFIMRREYANISMTSLQLYPYARIAILLLFSMTILATFESKNFMAENTPSLVIVLFGVLKIIQDLFGHIFVHRNHFNTPNSPK